MSRVILLAAVAANGVIGGDNKMLWDIPEDRKRFRETTMGYPVIMGRKTWDSLPPELQPLPGRFNIVISRKELAGWRPDLSTDSLAAALGMVDDRDKVFIIGGAEIYKLALEADVVDEMQLTELDEDYEGDAYFPFGMMHNFADGRYVRGKGAYDFVTYMRLLR